jgi:uncharacterized integral membrane protein
MEPNYPNYTTEELLSALSKINRDKFPERTQAIQLELAKREVVYSEQPVEASDYTRQQVYVEILHKSDASVTSTVIPPDHDYRIVPYLIGFVLCGIVLAFNADSFSIRDYFWQFSFPAITVLAMLFGYVFYFLRTNARTSQSFTEWTGVKTADQFIGQAIMVSLTLAIMAINLCMQTGHAFTSKPDVVIGEVTSVYNQTRTRIKGGTCSYSMQVQTEHFGSFEWCHVRSDFLMYTEVGDKIRLQGTRSGFGFKVENYRRIKD